MLCLTWTRPKKPRPWLCAVLAGATLASAGLQASLVQAADLSGSDRPMLTLSCADGRPVKSFSAEQLRQLPQATIQTALPAGLGGIGRQDWSGVTLQTLLEQSHCTGTHLKMLALNAYADTIPLRDIDTYGPVLAYARNGQPLTVRDKGPLIVIYPFDQHPELNSQVYLNRSVWQVYAIEIR